MVSSRVRSKATSVLVVVGVVVFAPLTSPTLAYAADPTQVHVTLEGCKLPDNASSCVYPTDFTTGSLGKNWAELDLVPYHLTLTNNGADQTYDIRLSADHLLGSITGYDFITTPTATGAGCTLTVVSENDVSPTGVVGGVDKVLSTRLQLHQTVGSVCAISYSERLAIGSHLYSGASLQSQVLNADYSSTGQRTVSIPVNEIAPQEISKTAAAFSTPHYTWTVTKSSPVETVDIDSCQPTPTAPNVTYTVSYTRTKVAGTTQTVSGSITLTNPAHRSLVASVTDTVKRDGTPVGGGTLPDVTVPASGSVTVPYSFSISNDTGVLSNTASATYHDPESPGADLSPLDVTVAVPISPTELPGTGATAVITDLETASSGLLYSRTTPNPSGFLATDSFTKTASDTGSFGISKIVASAAPGNFDGTLTNAVGLLPDGDNSPVTSSVTIPIHVHAASPTLTIDKHVDVAPDTDTTFTFTVTNDQTHATTAASITVAAHATSGTTQVTVAPSTSGYTVAEGSPPAGYDPAADVHTGALALCGSGSVRVDDTRSRAGLTVTKTVSGDDAPQAGFVFDVSCSDGTTATLTFHGSGSQLVSGIQTGSLCHVTETAVAGWTSSPSGTQDVTVNAGGASVSFTNTRNLGSVSVTKTITGDSAPADGFVFAVSCTDGTTATLTFHQGETQTVDDILSGSTCTVTETAVPGWTSTPSGPQTVALGLGNGATQTVSFTNTRNTGTLGVTKAISGDDPPVDGFTFLVGCSDGTTASLTFHQAETQTVDGILTGSTCTVSETPVDGWTSTPSGPQTVILDLANGSTATVSFTNTRNVGSLSVTKAIDGDSAPADGFVFAVSCTDGTTATLTFHQAETQTVDAILSGSTCTVTETAVPGWTSTPSGPQTVILGLANGATRTVSFTNTRNVGSVSVTKAIDGDSAPADGFVFAVSCTDGTTATLTFHQAETQTVDGILSGSTCTVTETVLEGWNSTPEGPQTVTLDLADGSTAAVSFTNTRQIAGLKLVKTVDKTEAGFGDTLTYGLTVTNTAERPLHAAEVSDPIPAKTTYVGGSATCPAPCTATYDGATDTVHFAVGDLAPGASFDGLTFQVTIDTPKAAADGGIPAEKIVNSGTTSSPPDITDPVPSNEVVTTVTAVLGVKIVKPLPRTGAAVPVPQSLLLAMALLLGGAGITYAGSWRDRIRPVEADEE